LRLSNGTKRVGNRTGDQPSFRERHPAVVARVHDERRAADGRQVARHVHGVEAADQPDRVFGRCRHPLQVDEPAGLLRPAVGNEYRRVDLAENRIVAAPAKLDELEHRIRLVHFLRREIAFQPAARECAIENQVADPIGMARGIGDRHAASLAAAQQHEALQPRGIDDRLEIAQARLEREVGRVAVGQAAPAAVITHACEMLGEFRQARAPDGAFPVVLQMVEPGRDFDHRRSATRAGIGDAHAIRGPAEANRARHVHAFKHGPRSGTPERGLRRSYPQCGARASDGRTVTGCGGGGGRFQTGPYGRML
jgi:hypothetical protein